MGFFKAVRDLQQQGNEINRNRDVGAELAGAQARMVAAQEAMAQQTQAANLAATGLDGTATIGAVRQGSTMVNFQPLLEIDLVVMVAGRPPMPVTYKGVVEQIHLARAYAGAQVAVKVDRADPSIVWMNWMAPVAAAPVAAAPATVKSL